MKSKEGAPIFASTVASKVATVFAFEDASKSQHLLGRHVEGFSGQECHCIIINSPGIVCEVVLDPTNR